MKSKISKQEAQEKIVDFFKHKNFTSEELKKVKRLAMKHQIKLKLFRKNFCKFCLNPLRGETRITKTHKIVLCEFCQKRNRFIMHD